MDYAHAGQQTARKHFQTQVHGVHGHRHVKYTETITRRRNHGFLSIHENCLKEEHKLHSLAIFVIKNKAVFPISSPAICAEYILKKAYLPILLCINQMDCKKSIAITS